MSYPHPKYPNIMVFDGGMGEIPRPGAFYLPRKGDTMLKIAGKAWGTKYSKLHYARILNSNRWNKGNLVYRNSDSSCHAKIIPSVGAESAYFGSGPWVALGCPMQAVWIPPLSDPDAVPVGVDKKPSTASGPGIFKKRTPATVMPGLNTPGATSRGGGGGTLTYEGGEQQAGIVSGGKWWLYALVGVGILGAGVWFSRRKKR